MQHACGSFPFTCIALFGATGRRCVLPVDFAIKRHFKGDVAMKFNMVASGCLAKCCRVNKSRRIRKKSRVVTAQTAKRTAALFYRRIRASTVGTNPKTGRTKNKEVSAWICRAKSVRNCSDIAAVKAGNPTPNNPNHKQSQNKDKRKV